MIATEELKSRLEEIFKKIFRTDSFEIRRDLTAFDVNGWDSLNHIRLIGEIEKNFKIRFSDGELASLDHVGALMDLIQIKA